MLFFKANAYSDWLMKIQAAIAKQIFKRITVTLQKEFKNCKRLRCGNCVSSPSLKPATRLTSLVSQLTLFHFSAVTFLQVSIICQHHKLPHTHPCWFTPLTTMHRQSPPLRLFKCFLRHHRMMQWQTLALLLLHNAAD